MPDNTLHEFLASSTQKAADELSAAFLRIPEDKRDWTPGGNARSALDQVAECALLNGYTVEMLRTRAFPLGGGFQAYLREKEEAKAQGWEHLSAMLQENTRRFIDACARFPRRRFPPMSRCRRAC